MTWMNNKDRHGYNDLGGKPKGRRFKRDDSIGTCLDLLRWLERRNAG